MKVSIMNWIKQECSEATLLLRNIPSTVVSLFVVSVICMNLLANKTLLQTEWIALDGGILISWLSFMCMDIITKHFGPKASNRISLLASVINLLTCLIFFVASIIPSNADDYTVFDNIFGGTWFILLGSTIAFLTSAGINNFLNWMIGRGFHKNPDGKLAYVARTYISTFVGQFCDNLIFRLSFLYALLQFIGMVSVGHLPSVLCVQLQVLLQNWLWRLYFLRLVTVLPKNGKRNLLVTNILNL